MQSNAALRLYSSSMSKLPVNGPLDKTVCRFLSTSLRIDSNGGDGLRAPLVTASSISST